MPDPEHLTIGDGGVAATITPGLGAGLSRFPETYSRIRKHVATRLIFLEADDEAIMRREGNRLVISARAHEHTEH